MYNLSCYHGIPCLLIFVLTWVSAIFYRVIKVFDLLQTSEVAYVVSLLFFILMDS